MKTVRIPKWNNLFVVHVNNRKYSYPAGTIQIVPNEVADAINNVIINMPKEKDSTSIIEAVNELKGEVDALKAAYNPENVITEDVFLHELGDGIYIVKDNGRVKLHKESKTQSMYKASFVNGIMIVKGSECLALGYSWFYATTSTKTKALLYASYNSGASTYTINTEWKEDRANKTKTIATTGTGSDAKYPTEKAVKSYVESVLSNS